MSVILLGYRGCGKTSVGRRLADRLWQPFVDTDALVVRAAGMSIREIFAGRGEEHFRDLEASAVEAALRLDEHVIALGGGAVLREGNRSLLLASDRRRVYLRCAVAELARRLAADPASPEARPSLTGVASAADPAEIEAVLARREPLYRQVATAELDVTDLSVEEAVNILLRML